MKFDFKVKIFCIIQVVPILADNPQHNCSETDSRPLDELLAFIEGDEEGEGAESRPSP